MRVANYEDDRRERLSSNTLIGLAGGEKRVMENQGTGKGKGDFDERCRVWVACALHERRVADPTFRTSAVPDFDVYYNFWLATVGAADGVSARKRAAMCVSA